MGVPTTVYIHTNIYNYSNKYKNLDRFQKDVKQFLKEYDRIVLHKDLYKLAFKSYLREIRSKVKILLCKFDATPLDDGSARPEKEMMCCGLAFTSNEQFRNHYKAVHNEAFLVYPNMLEVRTVRTRIPIRLHNLQSFSFGLCKFSHQLKSAFAKLDHMRHRLDEYTRFGKEYTCTMLVDLKRIAKRISCTLKF
uniref:Uncharacterized protein n=1 Tax=Anopheles epiroticus TaxID=199890 RepID=A0A240PK79_9DIPT